MYLPTYHAQPDGEALYALIEAHPLGTWVCRGAGGLIANHLPFLLDRTRGPCGSLLGHVSRANPVWRDLLAGEAAVVTFQGPQAYISPGWYPGKAEHGKVVPTWDYAVAHVHGTPRVVQDGAWLLDVLSRLTAVHEAAQAAPWRVADAPADFIDKLLGAVVGIEIPIERLSGKLKASQDETLADRLGTVRGLRAAGTASAAMMAALVQQAIDTTPGD
ncbi:FMN-binding negative transcriptional regulator [Massilia sp. DWR3-1-1]|uniref:FMN-binding negative transcriptional regulator n=1 Tax=Massilia sp. DWR3-1-1 TaxID=2804559 RepID=UPI003CED39A7